MLKIGVVGAGHLGKIHIRLLLELVDEFELIGFFDPNDEIAKEVIEKFGLKRFETIEALMAQVDCVDIVTPTFAHFETASFALKNSKHVFIEKPITR